MAVGQVLAELRAGLKRNVSMTLSLVVTLVVSLALVGIGLLLQIQIGKTEAYWGDRLQIQVELCAENSQSGKCIQGAATEAEAARVAAAIEDNPEVESYYLQSPQEAYEKAEERFGQTDTGRRLFEALEPESFSASYWVTLKDPQDFDSVTTQVKAMPGVNEVVDLRDLLEPMYNILGVMRWLALGTAGVLVLAAVLQVANTIRLAAFARRREIGIMRLVGASAWHIQLPFLLESLLAAVVGAVLACGVLVGFMQFLVRRTLAERLGSLTPWVEWNDVLVAGGLTVAFGLVVALVPTVVVTRKYLDV
jgi:cell division transport system permease protein